MTRRASTIIEQASRKAGRGHKAPARLWLESNAPRIREALTANQLSWVALHRELLADGIASASPAALASAWSRVKGARQMVMPGLYSGPMEVAGDSAPSFGTIRKKEST